MIRSPNDTGLDYIGVTALVAAISAALGRLWGTHSDRSTAHEREREAVSTARERVLEEYQGLLSQLGKALGESESSRRELEKQILDLTAVQVRQTAQIERLEKHVLHLDEILEKKTLDLEEAMEEISSLENEVERLQKRLEAAE